MLVGLLEARQDGAGGPVPVLISAAAYDARRSWDDWLAGHLALRSGLGAKAAARLVRDGRIVPVVDGLDEMDPPGRPGRAAALNAAMRGRARAPVVVTCRPGEYQDLARAISRATHVEMLPLSGDEAAGYLRAQLGSQDEQRRWAPVLASLEASPGGPLAAQLATPWRLTLALAAFGDDGDPSSLLPPAPPLASGTAQEYAERDVPPAAQPARPGRGPPARPGPAVPRA